MMNYVFNSTKTKMMNPADYQVNEKTKTNIRLSWYWIQAHTLIPEPTLNKTHRLERVTRLALKLLMKHSSQSEHLALIRSHRQGATRSSCRWWRGSHTMRATSHPLHFSPPFCFALTHRLCNTLTKTHYNLWASAFTDSKNEEPDTVIHQ